MSVPQPEEVPSTALAEDEEPKPTDGLPTEEDKVEEQKIKQTQLIRYSFATLLSYRNSKLSQQKPPCKNLELSCMIHGHRMNDGHHKPPPKILVANMMPKFALNRGEESISPLSFHSNSSSSSNLSYQKRYQQDNAAAAAGGGSGDGYNNSRYYYNKYNKYDDNNGSGSSRIIYKTTGANSTGPNGNNNMMPRFLRKAHNSKYENQESSLGLISNKNILDNASHVITAADHRNSKKKMEMNDAKEEEANKEEKASDKKQLSSDDTNNNEKSPKSDAPESTKVTEVNANDLMVRNNGQKDHSDDKVLDEIFNNFNINQLLPDEITDERESSRFSKWFSSNKEEPRKVPDVQNNNEGIQIHETDKYFQPIDKVENNQLFQMLKGQQPSQDGTKEDNPLMNMIQQNQQKSPNSGQVHSVEELEARLRHHKAPEERKNTENEQKVLQNFFQQQLMVQQQQQQQQQQQNQHPAHNQEDVNAFKKLLSQITDESKAQAMPQNGQKNLLHSLMGKNFPPQSNAELMMQQQQQQKVFPPIGKMPGKMMNPIGSPSQMPPQHMMAQTTTQIDMMKLLPQKMPTVAQLPEVQGLVQELTSGEISQYNLWQRLTAPGLTPIEREIITSALNIFNANSNNGNSGLFPKQIQPPAAIYQPAAAQNAMMMNALTAPIQGGSPLSPVPPLDQHLLFQHQAAAAAAAAAANKQLRLSPLPAGIPNRIPSPRELQYHTQSIMQNALIRKKLEEQRENFRKRQEQEQQQKHENDKKGHTDGSVASSSTSGIDNSTSSQVMTTSVPSQQQTSADDNMTKIQQLDSPTKKQSAQPLVAQPITPAQHPQIQRQHAPSPSIFTPTSVLRKMTAEKEGDNKMGQRNDDKKKAMNSIPNIQQQQQRIQQQFNMGNMSQFDRLMQMQAQQQAQNEMTFGKANTWETQQQQQSIKPPGRPIVKAASGNQQNPMMGSGGGGQQNMMNTGSMSSNFDYQQQQQIQKMNMQKQYIHQQQMMQMKQKMDNPVLSQIIAQQQQRAQQQNMMRPQQFQQQQQQQQNMMQMMQGRSKEQDEHLETRNMTNNGCLSPTSNQLAKWFSPELLDAASAGKLPSLNVNQMLSLEEFEKCIQNP